MLKRPKIYRQGLLIFLLTILAFGSVPWARSTEKSSDPLTPGRRLYLQGKGDLVPSCISCHGPINQGLDDQEDIPILFADNSPYYLKQLQDFKDQIRPSTVMGEIVKSISSQEILDLVNEISRGGPLPMGEGKRKKDKVQVPRKSGSVTQSGRKNIKIDADKKKIQGEFARAENIARNGIIDVRQSTLGPRQVFACFACHGPQAEGVPPHFPRLRCQKKGYLLSQMQAFQQNHRINDPLGLMQKALKNITDADLQSLSTYFSNHLCP